MPFNPSNHGKMCPCCFSCYKKCAGDLSEKHIVPCSTHTNIVMPLGWLCIIAVSGITTMKIDVSCMWLVRRLKSPGRHA